MRTRILSLLTLAVVAAAAAGTATGGTPTMPPASSFTARVDNTWFPLRPGTRYLYTGVKDGKSSRDVVTVTRQTRRIEGVPCVAVRDRLYLRGHLAERTTDWYSQDSRDNVWYFGENTAELDPKGHVTSTEGTWMAGVNGAKAGIFMPGHPHVGQTGRQEYLKGHAEDHFQVIGLFRTVAPAGKSERVAHEGMDAARAGRDRPQDVRARDRHRSRANPEGRQRAQRAHRGDPELTPSSSSGRLPRF